MKRNQDGTFKDSVDVGRSLAADRRSKSKSAAKPGYGDQGDQPKRTAKKAAKKTTKKAGKKAAKSRSKPMPTSVEPMLATKSAPFLASGLAVRTKVGRLPSGMFFS